MLIKDRDFEFSVFGRVDLAALYEEWSREPGAEEYEEPVTGWVLKFSYVFENGICALLFENTADNGTACYRVLFFSGEGNTFELVKKVRFSESGSFRIDAVGIDKDLNLLFIRRSRPEADGNYCCREIGNESVSISGLTVLPEIAMRQSRSRFALADGSTVLFFKAPDRMRPVLIFEDRHDLLYIPTPEGGGADENGGLSADDVGDVDIYDDEDDDEDEENDEDDTCCHVKAREPEPAAGPSAMEELRGLIGLEGIKEKVDQIVAFAKLRKMAKDRGRRIENVNLNLAFLGNPGTAKTTVARIFARIMKENGLLSRGDLIEVGRADLVAKYTGQTAIKVKGVFEKAKGNVLFIDEAYSLVDSWENEYGDEAIATIVQEMENNRDDMIVIFAGYPDKMEKFLSRNPGLRSRVPFQVEFKDYTADELTAIAKSEAARRGYTVSGPAEKKIRDICAAAMRAPEFGNGRFSRNLVEAAIMRSACRTMRTMPENADLDAFFVLEDCDFSAPDNLKKEKAAGKIGFSAA